MLRYFQAQDGVGRTFYQVTPGHCTGRAIVMKPSQRIHWLQCYRPLVSRLFASSSAVRMRGVLLWSHEVISISGPLPHPPPPIQPPFPTLLEPSPSCHGLSAWTPATASSVPSLLCRIPWLAKRVRD